jgi:hypothetical protein
MLPGSACHPAWRYDAGLQLLRAGLSEFIETNTTSRFIAAQMAEALGQAGRLGLAVIEDEELWATAELLRIKGELVRMLGISESSAAAENQFRRPWHGNDDRPKVRRGQARFHAAATAACHRAVASARNALSVYREMRWR